jgi:hypothetical protein
MVRTRNLTSFVDYIYREIYNLSAYLRSNRATIQGYKPNRTLLEQFDVQHNQFLGLMRNGGLTRYFAWLALDIQQRFKNWLERARDRLAAAKEWAPGSRSYRVLKRKWGEMP